MERLTTSVITLLLTLSFVNAKANDVPRQNEDDTLRCGIYTALDYCQERQPKVARFNTIDPKADRYPGINPYLYCAGNPIKYVDPDGKEVVKSFTEDKRTGSISEDDYSIIKATEMTYSQRNWLFYNNIVICAHGSGPKQIAIWNDEIKENEYISTFEDFKRVFLDNSVVFTNMDENECGIIVLMCCKSGMGDDNIAKLISENLPNMIIVAPSENVCISNNKIIGVSKTKKITDNNGKTHNRKIGHKCGWKMYFRGEMKLGFYGTPVFKDETVKKYYEEFLKQYEDK